MLARPHLGPPALSVAEFAVAGVAYRDGNVGVKSPGDVVVLHFPGVLQLPAEGATTPSLCQPVLDVALDGSLLQLVDIFFIVGYQCYSLSVDAVEFFLFHGLVDFVQDVWVSLQLMVTA